MPRYMYVFRGVDTLKRELSPEDMQKLLTRWSQWAATFRKRDALKGGSPLAPEGVVVSPGGVVSDGPFVESKELVGGFFIVECDDLEQAAHQAKGCPGLDHEEMTVEVRPLLGSE